MYFWNFLLRKIPLAFKGSRQKHWLIHRIFSNLQTLCTKAFLEETYFHFCGDLEVWCNLFSHTFFHHINLYYLDKFLSFLKYIEVLFAVLYPPLWGYASYKVLQEMSARDHNPIATTFIVFMNTLRLMVISLTLVIWFLKIWRKKGEKIEWDIPNCQWVFVRNSKEVISFVT